MKKKQAKPDEIVQRAFGSESRQRMLREYFALAGAVTPVNAWVHVYRLLLWIDRTTGLAHCYESDKCQPGRPWYGRSLSFHDWVSSALGVAPADLRQEIDWLFRRGSESLAKVIVKQQADRASLAAEQRGVYEGRNFPQPGADPHLETLVREELGPWLGDPPPEAMQRLTQRIHTYLAEENKRKNLVGEGFEDVLASLIARLPGAKGLTASTRGPLHSLPGFRPPPANEKMRKVDLAITGPARRRILATVKWSVRADREEQFGVDFEAYARLEDEGRDFDFILVTNEFDAARLCAACERRRQNAALFTSVVHVNPDGPLVAYGPKPRKSVRQLAEHVASGRIISLARWLASLTS